MINNKKKDYIIKTIPINTQKIKNLIHFNDLKKLKKFTTISSYNYNDYINRQTKLIFKKLAKKYNRGAEYYYRKVITDIIDNEPSHLVSSFKEYLIYGDYSEFMQGYFNLSEIIKFLPLIFEYYHSSTVIFPNYVALKERKYIYKNIQKKQQIINIQQEQEEIDEKKRKKKEEKEKRDKNDIISYESDTTKSDIITQHALNSILNQTNTSNNQKLFGLNGNNNSSEDMVEFIEKLKNEEKKMTLKNKNQKNRNKHIISIHKGNNSKKDTNKSNNTNTCNTLSTKNNTKGKEKSNGEVKSSSDKNIKKNYNLSSNNLNYSRNINKHFLMKLNQIKRKNEERTVKNILLEMSALNTSRKLKKMNFISKKNNNLKDFNKSKGIKAEIKMNEKETMQINNYNHRQIKRIKSCYGMNQTNSRNRKILCENSLFSKDSNNSNKNISKNGFTYYNINNSTTINNIFKNGKKFLSIDNEKNKKRTIPKKNYYKFDSKVINVIYSKHLPFNYSSKNCIDAPKYLFKYKINKKKLNLPNSKKKHKIQKSENKFSLNNTKMGNPFETKISPPHSNTIKNKTFLKFKLLSPNNINAKLSSSRIIHKKLLNKNVALNNRKVQFKKNIKKVINENKSNKMFKRKNIITGRQIYINNDYLTIDVVKNHNHSPSINPIDMKKNIENRNITNSIKNEYHRTNTLYNKMSDFYVKYKK